MQLISCKLTKVGSFRVADHLPAVSVRSNDEDLCVDRACAILPRGVPHRFRNSGLAPARLIFVITPGRLEDYFIAISKFGPMPPGPADLAKLAEPYGLTLLPPGY